MYDVWQLKTAHTHNLSCVNVGTVWSLYLQAWYVWWLGTHCDGWHACCRASLLQRVCEQQLVLLCRHGPYLVYVAAILGMASTVSHSSQCHWIVTNHTLQLQMKLMVNVIDGMQDIRTAHFVS